MFALFGFLDLAACPKPTDGEPQIAISPNVAGRWHALPAGHGGRPRERPDAIDTSDDGGFEDDADDVDVESTDSVRH